MSISFINACIQFPCFTISRYFILMIHIWQVLKILGYGVGRGGDFSNRLNLPFNTLTA